jgi:F0F1-type ATP synthase membrane subunit a
MLMVCYALPVLGTNVGMVLAHGIAHQYTRYLYGVGHVYIGEGQHTMLRSILGSIETTSTLFRSVSLALRTVCNATAGHVLLAVLLEMTTSRYCVGDATLRMHSILGTSRSLGTLVFSPCCGDADTTSFGSWWTSSACRVWLDPRL